MLILSNTLFLWFMRTVCAAWVYPYRAWSALYAYNCVDYRYMYLVLVSGIQSTSSQ